VEWCGHAPVVASFGLAVKVGALMVRGRYWTSLAPIALFRALVFDALGIVEMGPDVSLWGRCLGKLFAGGSTRGPLATAVKRSHAMEGALAKWSGVAMLQC
jgi:hypothetical protein